MRICFSVPIPHSLHWMLSWVCSNVLLQRESNCVEKRENLRLGTENVFIRLLMNLGPVMHENLCIICNYYTSWRFEQKSRQAGRTIASTWHFKCSWYYSTDISFFISFPSKMKWWMRFLDGLELLSFASSIAGPLARLSMNGFLMETPQRLPRPHVNHLCVKGFLIMLSYSNESESTSLGKTEETGLACLLYLLMSMQIEMRMEVGMRDKWQ